MSGAKIAVNTKIATSAKPTIAPGFRTRRCQASRQSPLGASSWISLLSSSATDTSAHPDARVEEGVGDVDEQVHDDEDPRDEEDSALEDWVVAVLDRLREPRPHAGNGEHGLGENRTGQEKPGLEPDDRDDREPRVAEDVTFVDDARCHALRARSPHVVLVLDVEYGRSSDPRDDRKRDRAERDRRQYEVQRGVPGSLEVQREDAVEDVEAGRVVRADEDVLAA